MSGIERKIKRNQIKAALKKQGMKKTMPLSKYRFKTKEELEAERADALTNQMLEQAKKSGLDNSNLS